MSGHNHTPEDNLTGWITETRQQNRDQEDQKLKHVPRGTKRDECFATLPLGGQDQFRVRMKEEMNKEYNDFLSKQKLGRRSVPESTPAPLLSDDRARSHIPLPKSYSLEKRPDERDRGEPAKRRGEGLEHERGDHRDYDSYRKEPMGPPPLAPRYDPLEELRLRRYFEDQLYARPRQEYHGYPPPPPVPDAYRYNPYVNYYQQMDRAWAPERDARRSSPRREKRVTFPEEWPEESDLYGWAQQGRRSEMKLREYEREEQRVERRGGSESPLNRSRSAPPDKKERSAGGFMDGFGSGNRGRDEEKRRREDYAKELKEQIRNKQIKQSVDIGDKRVSRSRPPTPPSRKHFYESPPTKQQPLSPADPLDYYKPAVQPDHHSEREYFDTRHDEEKTPEQKQTYRQVLEQQIEEGRQRKAQKAREIAKSKAEPVEEWSPWGRGGGGAPLKDNTGRVVADLKVLNQAYQVREKTGSSPKLEDLADICVLKSSVSPAQRSLAPYEASTPTPSPSKKEVAVTPQQEYREYLRQQVEEKKAKKLEEDARKREEDRKEVERLEKERVKLQEDYRREVEKQRAKEEAIRMKNEELKLAAEVRRNAPSPAKRGRARERRSSPPPDLAPLPAPVQQPREYSPPIPTLRNTPRPQQPPEYPTHDVRSPPIPALRRYTRELTPPPQPVFTSPPHFPIKNSDTMELVRPASPFSPHPVHTLPNADLPADSPAHSHLPKSEDSRSDVVRQLTDMKQQLRYEKDRVKEQLELSRTTYQDMADLLPSRSQQLPPKISKAAKPPFKIRKSVIPVKPPIKEQETGSKGLSVKREGRRTVGFHLQNTQLQNKGYHREYTPLLKGRGTSPTQSRPDSTGSNISISTLEIEALALKNDNRRKRLESLLKSNQELEIRKPSPESIINQLLANGTSRRGHLPFHHPRQEDFPL